VGAVVSAGLGAVVAVGVALGVDVGVALGVAVGVALGVAVGVELAVGVGVALGVAVGVAARAITNSNTLGTRCSVDACRGRRTSSTATSKVRFSAEVRESVGMWFEDLKAAERSGSSS
jgi:hypothetical protein